MAKAPSLLQARRDQVFPTLEAADIARLQRFGEARSFAAGEAITAVGETGLGLTLVVSGRVAVTRRNPFGRTAPIVVYGPGQFMGELAQLSGRPSFVDGKARTAVEAVAIAPERLRALLIAEAELGERIMRALILRRVVLLETPGFGPIIIGPRGDGQVLNLEGFLSRNGQPFHALDPDTDEEARTLIERFHLKAEALPIVLCPGGQILRRPDENQLGRCLGMVSRLDPARIYDLAIVGAGPAGLAAAVYAASEGLSVLILDRHAFGGQAGASARIENYLGFPTGISGMALMGRANSQALKFGVEMAIPDEAAGLAADSAGYALRLVDGEAVRARAVIVASGARYRHLGMANIEAFEGASAHHWASPLEARLCAGQEVALVGGGNSAGQGAVYLAGHARKVWLLIRRSSLEASMSRYLIDRIANLANIELVPHVEVSELGGEGGALSSVTWRDLVTGAETRKDIAHLFLFIGADPNTGWLAKSGAKVDGKGFLLTGAEAGASAGPLETSLPGVFAIGDVRSGSTKRVSAAVGEGAQVVAAVHAHLTNRQEDPPEGADAH